MHHRSVLGGDVGKFGGKQKDLERSFETLPNSTFRNSHTSKIISPLQVALTLFDPME